MNKILIDQATVKLVLGALEKDTQYLPLDFDYHFEAITALREALAEQEEPVEWQHRKPMMDSHGNTRGYTNWLPGKGLEWWPHRALYASPQPAQRKPLTVDQIRGIYEDCDAPTSGLFTVAFARAIEAAHNPRRTHEDRN